MKTESIIFNFFLTLLLLIFFEIISSLFGVITGLSFLNFNFAIFFSLYIILAFGLKSVPYALLLIQMIHSLFSFDHWGIETLAALIICVIFKSIENAFRLDSYLYLVFYAFAGSFFWIVLTSVLLSAKAQSSELILINIGNSIIEIVLLSLAFPFLHSLLSKFHPIVEAEDLV